MALAAVNVTIVIDKESYSIVEIPPQTSGIVIKQKEGLLQQVNLKVNMYIRIYMLLYVIPYCYPLFYGCARTASNTAETSAGLAVCCCCLQ